MGIIVETTGQTTDPKYLTFWNHVHVTDVSLVFACLQLFSLVLASVPVLLFPIALPIMFLFWAPSILTIIGITKTRGAYLLPTLFIDAFFWLAYALGGLVLTIGFIALTFVGNDKNLRMSSHDDWIIVAVVCVAALLAYLLSLLIATWVVKVDYLSFMFIREKERTAAHTVRTIFI